MDQISSNNLKKAYLLEGIMFLTYAFFAVNWIAGTALTPQIMAYFQLTSFSSATFITNAITLAKIIGNLTAAKLFKKLYPKKAIGFASLLIVVGTLLSLLSPFYWLFIASRFIMGFGGALFVVYFGPIVLNYFPAQRRATVNGINAASYNIGSLIAMVLVVPVIQLMGTWQNSLLFFGSISFILFLLWFFLGEDFELNKNSSNASLTGEKYTLKEALKEKFSYAFPFTYSGVLTLYIVILTLFPISKGAPVDPKILSSVVTIAGVVGTIVGIGLTKKLTKRLPILRFSGLALSASALVMILTNSTFIALTSSAFLGFFIFLPMTALVTIPQELKGMTPSKLTLIMGIFWSFSYIIETIFYYIIGLMIDFSGSFQSGLLLAVILSLTFFVGSFFMPETGKKS